MIFYGGLLIFIAFSAGILISGAVFSFIAIIGIVPRFAQKTETKKFIPLYEKMIVLGGILGVLILRYNLHLPLPRFLVGFIFICIGIFIGSLAVCLAEILNVIPVFMKRVDMKVGIEYFMLAIALGKLVGSLLYAIIPGFNRL